MRGMFKLLYAGSSTMHYCLQIFPQPSIMVDTGGQRTISLRHGQIKGGQ